MNAIILLIIGYCCGYIICGVKTEKEYNDLNAAYEAALRKLKAKESI